jgi:hypothetical protein
MFWYWFCYSQTVLQLSCVHMTGVVSYTGILLSRGHWKTWQTILKFQLFLDSRMDLIDFGERNFTAKNLWSIIESYLGPLLNRYSSETHCQLILSCLGICIVTIVLYSFAVLLDISRHQYRKKWLDRHTKSFSTF